MGVIVLEGFGGFFFIVGSSVGVYLLVSIFIWNFKEDSIYFVIGIL